MLVASSKGIIMSDKLILENFMPYRLARLSSTVSSTIARAYDKEFGLSIPEWRVIAILGRFPGLSAVEVAEQTFLDKVAVSRAVTKLLKSGRIDREFADADRRRSILNLSEKGREVHDRVAKLALEFEKNLLDGLNESDIESFDKVMDKLLARALKP
ncbi:MAG: MarR family transcriptional regulator [Proteobacteria bacterium]|nr:MarR family transcriptional regulator [Pseudomonadota bacterium]MCH8135782.1 MarR family transcriptional regulator [Pseudomonadota bacterium]